MTKTTDSIKIYVACLASYNAGTLHGKWIDLEGKDVDEVNEEIQAMLTDSPEPDAEEWAIHDYESEFYTIEEYSDIRELCKAQELLEEHGPAILAYADHIGADLDDSLKSSFEDAYRGEYSTEQEYAEQLIDDCYDLDRIMGNLAYYFDYQAFTRDLFISDCFSIDTPDGNVWVFDNI